MNTAAGAMWSVACLLIAAGAVAAVPGGLSGAVAVATLGCGLVLTAELLLLTVLLSTLTREDPLGEPAAVADLSRILAWPLRVGWWVGALVTGLVTIVTFFDTPGGDGFRGGSRFALSVMAVVGVVAALFTSAVLPGWPVAVAAVGAAVVLVALVRGITALIVRAIRR